MANLIRSMDAPAQAAERSLYVIFKVADCEYIVAADTVLQMESFSGATPVPGARRFVSGIVQIRGRLVPVVDLRILFGRTPGEATLDNRIVVGQHGDRVVGLLVDSAREVIRIAASEIKAPPAILSHQTKGFIKGVSQVGPRVLMLVDFERIIGEEALHGDEWKRP